MGASASRAIESQVRDLIRFLEYTNSTKYYTVAVVAEYIRKEFCYSKPPYMASGILKNLGVETLQFKPHDLHMIASKYDIDIGEIGGIYFGNGKRVLCTSKSKSEFTKAHEIFEHLFYGFKGYKEKHFNHGAAEFLMPEEEFTEEALSLGCNLHYLREIYYNCSPLAIATRLLALKLVDNFTVIYKKEIKKARENTRCNKSCQYDIGKDYSILLHWVN